MSEQDWYRTARRKVLIDNHLDDWLPGYEKYDSVKIADTIAGAGFEAGMIYARCHVGTCYWNASDGPKHRGLGEHDQIGELTQLRVVQPLGRLLSVARDEGHGCAAVQQRDGGQRLLRADGQLAGEPFVKRRRHGTADAVIRGGGL